MKIYTKTGDKGTTSLFDGTRVLKNHLRVDAYGDVDELNAYLGVVATEIKSPEILELVYQIQRDLFALGAKLANPQHKKQGEKASFTEEKVTFLEGKIDAFEEELEALHTFILPGGSLSSSLLHLSRCVCRRAERKMVALSQEEVIDPLFIKYINRLSDFLFVFARYLNKKDEQKETPWIA